MNIPNFSCEVCAIWRMRDCEPTVFSFSLLQLARGLRKTAYQVMRESDSKMARVAVVASRTALLT